jgi:hypothetical protein
LRALQEKDKKEEEEKKKDREMERERKLLEAKAPQGELGGKGKEDPIEKEREKLAA